MHTKLNKKQQAGFIVSMDDTYGGTEFCAPFPLGPRIVYSPVGFAYSNMSCFFYAYPLEPWSDYFCA